MKIVNSDKAFKPIGPFSHAVILDNYVYTCGVGGLDPKTNQVPSDDVEDQTVQCMENIKYILEEAGVGFKDVFKAIVYLTDIKDYAKVNAIYARYMGDNRPARCCVAVKELPANELMKIEVTARIPE